MSKIKLFIKKNLKIRYEIIICIIVSFLLGLAIHSGSFTLWPLFRLRENIENIFTDKEPIMHSFKAIPNNEFLEIWDQIRFNYLNYNDNIDEDKLLYDATKTLVSSLNDPFSYIEETKAQSDEKTGLIGIFMGYNENDLVEIASLDKNGPAYKAGLFPNDIIVKVDHESVLGKDTRTIKKAIAGEPDKNVAITVFREDNNTLITKNIIRAEDTEETVTIEESEKKGIYILRISSFTDDLYKKFDEALENIQPYEVKGLVIDLQNNPGGNLMQAVKVISNFIDKDLIILEKIDRHGTKTTYKSESAKYPFLIDLPKVILINSLSASCSEIMTVALKDHQEITIIGEKSFGKGVITEETQTHDEHILHLTIAKWYGPSGQYIHKKGIEPDLYGEEDIITQAISVF